MISSQILLVVSAISDCQQPSSETHTSTSGYSHKARSISDKAHSVVAFCFERLRPLASLELRWIRKIKDKKTTAEHRTMKAVGKSRAAVKERYESTMTRSGTYLLL